MIKNGSNDLLKLLLKKSDPITRNQVKYYLYNSNSFSPLENADKKHRSEVYYVPSTPCFANLCSEKRTHDNFNKICYIPKNPILSIDEIKKWLNECIKYKLLPDYISTSALDQGFVFDLSIKKHLLYVYLTNIRNIEEEPYLIKTVLYLIENGINIFPALVFASNYATINNNHNYIQTNYTWGFNGSPKIEDKDLIINFNQCLALKKYILSFSELSEDTSTRIGTWNEISKFMPLFKFKKIHYLKFIDNFKDIFDAVDNASFVTAIENYKELKE